MRYLLRGCTRSEPRPVTDASATRIYTNVVTECVKRKMAEFSSSALLREMKYSHHMGVPTTRSPGPVVPVSSHGHFCSVTVAMEPIRASH